jgi:hypothetical protein
LFFFLYLSGGDVEAAHYTIMKEIEDELNSISAPALRQLRIDLQRETQAKGSVANKAAKHVVGNTVGGRILRGMTASKIKVPTKSVLPKDSVGVSVPACEEKTSSVLESASNQTRNHTGVSFSSSVNPKAAVSVTRRGAGVGAGYSMYDPRYPPPPPQASNNAENGAKLISSTDAHDDRVIQSPVDLLGPAGCSGPRVRHPRHVGCQLDSAQLQSVSAAPSSQRSRSLSPNRGVCHTNSPHRGHFQMPYKRFIPAEEESSSTNEVLGRSSKKSNSSVQQSRSVVDVFRRGAAEVDTRMRNSGVHRGDHVLSNDISNSKKNMVLDWVQIELGVLIEPFVSCATPHVFNKLATLFGKGSPPHYDTIAAVPSHVFDPLTVSGNLHLRAASTSSEFNKENYFFFACPEDIVVSPGHGPQMMGTLSIATYLGRITGEAPLYHDVVSMRAIAHHQQKIMRSVVPGAMTSVGFLGDPWVNGVFLSQVISSMNRENKEMIKQVPLVLLFCSCFFT